MSAGYDRGREKALDSQASSQTGSLEELARQVRVGSSAALDELARRLRPRLVAFLNGRGLAGAEAEDICHETMLRLQRRLVTYDPGRPLLPWVLTIAWNLVVDRARQRKARPTCVPVDSVSPPKDSRPEPWRELAEADRRVDLWQTAERVLPARQFLVLQLHYAGGASVAEVARAMGLTRTHVKVLLHRARKRLLQVPRLREEL